MWLDVFHNFIDRMSKCKRLANNIICFTCIHYIFLLAYDDTLYNIFANL